jgi:hypothetical protein
MTSTKPTMNEGIALYDGHFMDNPAMTFATFLRRHAKARADLA